MATEAAEIRPRFGVRDVLVVLAVFAVTVGMLGGGDEPWHDGARTRDALGVVLAAASAAPLFFRRRAPLGAFAASALPSALINGLGYPPGPPLGPTVALFSVGRWSRTSTPVTAAVVGVMFAVHLGATWIGRDETPIVALLLGTVVWGGAWVVGDRVRLRRERAGELRRRAERDRRLAVAEERTRIARDLHDSAGHALNVILVQSGAARLLAEKDPVQARAALETIESVARETVGEIDGLVRALREDGAPAHGSVDPPVGLAALERLVARHADAGLDVSLDVRGESRPLTRAVDQAAYRIVQEALTNAARHGASDADVQLAFGERALELTVTNATRSEVQHVEGHGIVGMRERAAMLGGRVEIGRESGRFLVRAELPYGGET